MKENKSVLKKITDSREASLLIVLIVLCIVISLRSPSFMTLKSISDMLKNNAVIMIMTLGMLGVLLIGGIDISIASTLAFSGMSVGMLMKYGMVQNTFVLFLIAIGIGALCGLLIGLIISRAKWTKIGGMVYAVGSNREAAQISGINTANVELLVYTVMGTLSGLCGALAVSIYSSAQPNMLYGREMDVIAACVIGGVSMTGGRGSVAGALLGSLILAIIAKALPLVGIEAIAQNTVKGVIILVVIVLNVITQRMMDKNNLKGREM